MLTASSYLVGKPKKKNVKHLQRTLMNLVMCWAFSWPGNHWTTAGDKKVSRFWITATHLEIGRLEAMHGHEEYEVKARYGSTAQSYVPGKWRCHKYWLTFLEK